jgi:uracil phosphoribosyltransferase
VKAFPQARQGVVSAGRDEAAGMDEAGNFPISIDYVKVPEIGPDDTVIVADPMLATGSTMAAVLEEIISEATPERLLALSAVAAPAGLVHVQQSVPAADLLTVAVDERLDDDGYIVPGLGDAGDRAFGT